MKTSDLHSGGFQKYITIMSNAKNTPSIKVSIRGFYIPLAETMPTAIMFTSSNEEDTGHAVTIKTSHCDVKIIKVVFQEIGKAADNSMEIPLSWSLIQIDTVATGEDIASCEIVNKNVNTERATFPTARKISLYIHKFRLYCAPGVKENKYGEIIIKTNLPKDPEIILSGVIEIKKE